MSQTGFSLVTLVRPRLGRALVAGAICAGGWYAGVRPLERSLAAKAEAMHAMEVSLAAANEPGADAERLPREAARLEASFTGAKAWCESVTDPGQVYNALTRLASEHSVTLARIDPSGTRDVIVASTDSQQAPTARRRRGNQTAQASARGPVPEIIMYRLSARGAYENVCAFIADCETSLGASKVLSFSMRPALGAGAGVVEAEIETGHLKMPPTKKEEAAAKQKQGTP
ncbi:MAG TPA: hypothetical protein VD971_10630 [Phycisphaerales bacterium]|nr:hypothetical protein [Phycisphaerales bacterium]